MTLEEQKSKLFPLLQTAMEVELSTIPPYMTAWLSIYGKDKNHTPAKIIHQVMMEEMHHMELVGNLISSLGGKVCLNKDNIPTYPLKMNFQDRNFPVNLTAFSLDAIETFLKIEKPKDISLPFGGFEEIYIPAVTIGEFYDDLIHRLNKMCDEFGERAVFCGDPSKQIDQNNVITDKKSGNKALKIIINQGEGSGDSVYEFKPSEKSEKKVAHFFGFMEIHSRRYYSSTDKPRDYPSGECFTVDYNEVYPIKENAKSSDYKSFPQLAKLNDTFNQQYSLMLKQLEQAFNGQCSKLDDAIHSMHSMCDTAKKMMEIPISDDGKEKCGAPSFEWVEI